MRLGISPQIANCYFSCKIQSSHDAAFRILAELADGTGQERVMRYEEEGLVGKREVEFPSF